MRAYVRTCVCVRDHLNFRIANSLIHGDAMGRGGCSRQRWLARKIPSPDLYKHRGRRGDVYSKIYIGTF